MTTEKKGIAEQIIDEEAEETEEETDEEEGPSIEEEFRDLHQQTLRMTERMGKVADRYQTTAGKPATHADVANLYRAISGDVLELVKDLVAVNGAAVEDVFSELENVSSNSDDSDEDNTPDEANIQVYATLMANVEAFQNLGQVEELPAAHKAGFAKMVVLNEDALKLFDEQYGEEIKTLAQKYMDDARAAAAAETK